MLLPEGRIDPALGIERRDDDLGDGVVTLGMAGFTRQLDANLPKLRRQRAIQDGFGLCGWHEGQSLLRWRRIKPG